MIANLRASDGTFLSRRKVKPRSRVNESLSKDDVKPKQGPKVVVDEKVEQDVKVDVNSKPEEKPKEQLKES